MACPRSHTQKLIENQWIDFPAYANSETHGILDKASDGLAF